MKKIVITLLWCAQAIYAFSQGGLFTLRGTVTDASSAEPLPFASVKVQQLGKATSTDLQGKFSLRLSEGSYDLVVKFMGYQEQRAHIDLTQDSEVNFSLSPNSVKLDEVVIQGEKLDHDVTSTEMGTEELDVELIKKLPAILGEADPVKSIQLLPGVQNAGEGTGGFFVRGGDNSQNLVLLDDIPIYNASHLFGFFSVFNPDGIEQVKLYKSNMPAQYGGRLSSLLDVTMKQDMPKKVQGSAGIGIISSRFTVEAPLVEDKLGIMVAGRRSYVDLFLPLSPDTNVRKNKVYFYDVNAKLNYKVNDANRVTVSGYMGKDQFTFGDEFQMGWGNMGVSTQWRHTFSDRMFSTTSAQASKFSYSLGVPNGQDAFDWDAGVTEYGGSQRFKYLLNDRNTIGFGVGTTYRDFNLGEVRSGSDESIFVDFNVGNDYSFEHFAYISNIQKIGERLELDYGLRYTLFQQIGKDDVNEYGGEDGETVLSTTTFDNWESIQNYHGPEPRVGARYTLDSVSSVKASYTRTRQNIHLVSNATASSPFDVWISSSKHIKPQISDQWSVGYFRNFQDNMYAGSVEVYYKNMQNQIDFKPNKQLILNPQVETAVLAGRGYSYGAEFMVKKQLGDFQGWISYTLSRTQREIEGINNGKPYSPTYDKTHDIAIVGTYDLNDYWSFAGNWVFTTGTPTTFPAGNFQYQGLNVPYYTERNGFRLPDYHRLDLSATKKIREGKGLLFKKADRSLVFSVYNAYWRKNTFSIYFREPEDQPGETEAVKTYLFGTIPSVTYNIKF